MPSAAEIALRYAQEEWERVFDAGAYTSLPMLDLMLTKQWHGTSAGYRQLLKDPKKILGQNNKKVVSDDFGYDLNSVTYAASGRCTSFAIYVAYLLDRKHPGMYEWQYYDLKGHRIAVDRKNLIVLDSSSKRGAVLLPEDSVWTNWESDQKWKFLESSKSGKTKFETVNRSGDPSSKSSTEAISTGRCMRICMAEVAQRATALVYFRAMSSSGRPEFFGMISFNSDKHRFELVSNMSNREEGRVLIEFGSQGGRQVSNGEAMAVMEAFAAASVTGGPHGRAQWGASGVKSTMESIMKAAVDKYGPASIA